MTAARIRFLAGLLGAGCLALAAGALAVERGEDLAGDTLSAHPRVSGPDWREPEPPAGSAGDRAKPLLKLPEVVVKGDRQFQVSAERRDLVLTDPMTGAKEVPADLAAVAVPGLTAAKDAPAAETVAAKDRIFSAEAAGGTPYRLEGRFLAGQELEHVNFLLRSDYAAGAQPRAHGFEPFAQKVSAGLDLRTDAIPATDLTLSVSAVGGTDRQPESPANRWGDWLERGAGGLTAQAELALGHQAALRLLGAFQSFALRGAPADGRREGSARDTEIKAAYEQKLSRFLPGGLELLASLDWQGQISGVDGFGEPEVRETLRTLTVLGRLRPWALLALEAGIRLDDYQGLLGRSAAGVVGRVSLVLPTRTVLYAHADPELRWEPVAEWHFRNPYPAAGGLPRPENVKTQFRVGVRQNIGEAAYLDAAWFKRDASDTPAWLDPGSTGLFTYANLAESHAEGGQLELEVHYSPELSQTAGATYRRTRSDENRSLPYAPEWEAKTELKWALGRLSLGAAYRYLGARTSDPAERTPDLAAAHLLGASADWDLAAHWAAFLRLDNLLGAAYQEWRGYPARGLTGVAGLRVSF